VAEFTRDFQRVRHQILTVERPDGSLNQHRDPLVRLPARQFASLGATPQGIRGLDQPESRGGERLAAEQSGGSVAALFGAHPFYRNRGIDDRRAGRNHRVSRS